jgi:hypothetical protein
MKINVPQKWVEQMSKYQQRISVSLSYCVGIHNLDHVGDGNLTSREIIGVNYGSGRRGQSPNSGVCCFM